MLHICSKCGYVGEDGPLHNVPGPAVRECPYFADVIGLDHTPPVWLFVLGWLVSVALVLGLAWVATVYGPGPGAVVPAVGVAGDCAAPGAVPTPVHAGSAVVGVACV